MTDDRLDDLTSPDACLTASGAEVMTMARLVLDMKSNQRSLERSIAYWRSLAQKLQEEFCDERPTD